MTNGGIVADFRAIYRESVSLRSTGEKQTMAEGGKMLQQAVNRLIARTPRSRAVGARGTKLMPLEVAGTVEMPYTIYVESAHGARLTDVDGNTYIDMTMGFGPHVLGHNPP